MDRHFPLQNNKEEAEEKTRYWQLPWVPPPKEELPSEEELARKAALKEKAGQRLREMAAQKRSQKIAGLEEKISSLEELLEQLDEAEEDEASAILGRSGYLSPQEIKSDILKFTQLLRKAKGESNGNEDKADVSGADKYPLVSVPDEALTPEQVCVFSVIMELFMCSLGRVSSAFCTYKHIRPSLETFDDEPLLLYFHTS